GGLVLSAVRPVQRVDLLVADEREADLDAPPQRRIRERDGARHSPGPSLQPPERDGGQAPARFGPDDQPDRRSRCAMRHTSASMKIWNSSASHFPAFTSPPMMSSALSTGTARL